MRYTIWEINRFFALKDQPQNEKFKSLKFVTDEQINEILGNPLNLSFGDRTPSAIKKYLENIGWYQITDHYKNDPNKKLHSPSVCWILDPETNTRLDTKYHIAVKLKIDGRSHENNWHRWISFEDVIELFSNNIPNNIDDGNR